MQYYRYDTWIILRHIPDICRYIVTRSRVRSFYRTDAERFPKIRAAPAGYRRREGRMSYLRNTPNRRRSNQVSPFSGGSGPDVPYFRLPALPPIQRRFCFQNVSGMQKSPSPGRISYSTPFPAASAKEACPYSRLHQLPVFQKEINTPPDDLR